MFLKKRAKLVRKQLGDDRYICEMELEAGDIKSMLEASSVKAVKMLVTEPVVFAFGLWISFGKFLAPVFFPQTIFLPNFDHKSIC